jgi:hypothetical protein
MRRIISIVLALVFVFAAVPVSASKPLTMTVSPYDTNIAVETSTTNPDTITAFEELFANAKRDASLWDVEAARIARVTIGAKRYEVWRRVDDEVFLDTGGNTIDGEKFYALADSLGYNFYKHRAIPEVTVSGRRLAVTSSTYAFKKLDNTFYRSRYTKIAAPVIAGGASPVFSVTPKSATTSETPQGTVRITAVYENANYHGQVTYEYMPANSSDAPVSIVNDDTVPGELVILRATGVPEGTAVTARTGVNFTPQFFEESPGTWVALLPVSCYVQPGRHTVSIAVGDQTSNFEVIVRDKKFERQDLTVPAATAEETINSQKANDEYERNIAPLRTMADSTRYWAGRFIWPVKAQWRRTTQFGMQRYTNGSATASIHAALDMAAPTGTPTYATGAGRVLFAGNLLLTGGTIVIEHGYGLKSWYYHMNSIDVKAGDKVAQNQQIGTVGSTGFSTGPHLHFGMSVGSPHSGQFFINPETLITTDLAA